MDRAINCPTGNITRPNLIYVLSHKKNHRRTLLNGLCSRQQVINEPWNFPFLFLVPRRQEIPISRLSSQSVDDLFVVIYLGFWSIYNSHFLTITQNTVSLSYKILVIFEFAQLVKMHSNRDKNLIQDLMFLT